jgi:type I restriction enzyme, S subunit
MRYVGLEHIESQTMKLLGHGYARDIRSPSVRFSAGDVLYGKMRPYLNKVWLAEFEGVCSAEFLVFPKCAELNSQFFAMRLNAEDFVTFANGQVSGERPRVDFQKLSGFRILLPPKVEQERIVTKVNAALSRFQRADIAARRAQQRLNRYRDGVLHAAATGEFTRDWRKLNKPTESSTRLRKRLLEQRRARWEEAQLKRLRAAHKSPKDDKWKSRYREPAEPGTIDLPEIPRGWAWMSVDQLTFHLTSGSRDWSKYYNRGNGTFLMAQNIRRSGLDLSFRQAIGPPANHRDRERSQVIKHDVLVTIVGANTGDVCVVPKDLSEHFVCQSVALMRLAEPALSRFVWLYLAATDGGQKQWRKMIYGAGRPHLGLEHLRITAVPVPPSAEQTEIIRQVDHRLSAADQLSIRLDRQLDRARTVRQSLLREAFQGKLVPQDLNHESASVLVRHIRATREAEITNQQIKRMPQLNPKSMTSRRSLLDVLRKHKKPITPEALFREAGFQPSQADIFYRELASLRKLLREKKPSPSEGKAWPYRAHVLLQLKD